MELKEKLKLAFKAGKVYQNNWTEKFYFNEKYSFDNWFTENEQLLINDVSKSFYCQNIDNGYKDSICSEQCTFCKKVDDMQ